MHQAPCNSPTVVVVMPIHNALTYVQRTLMSLDNKDVTVTNWPRVLVNDASDAPTREFLMNYAQHTPHTVLHNTSQQLFTRTSNRGLRKAYELYHPEYLVLMNSDCDLKPGWDTALLRCMEDPAVGLAGYRDSTPEDHREIFQTEPFYNVEHPGYVTGHLLMFRTEALLKTGVFCETDTDGRTFPEIGAHLKGLAHLASDRKLSGDMQLNGFKSVYCNWPGVDHEAGKSWNHDLMWLINFRLEPMWEANDYL